MPLHDQAAVDLETDRWALPWDEKAAYSCSIELAADDFTLEPLTVDILRCAAPTFPVYTGLGACNLNSGL